MTKRTLPTMMMLSLLFSGLAGAQDDPHACSFKVWLGKTAEFEKMLAEATTAETAAPGLGDAKVTEARAVALEKEHEDVNVVIVHKRPRAGRVCWKHKAHWHCRR